MPNIEKLFWYAVFWTLLILIGICVFIGGYNVFKILITNWREFLVLALCIGVGIISAIVVFMTGHLIDQKYKKKKYG